MKSHPNENVLLLVEDNEDDVFLMERALREGRVTNPLYVVRDGEEALEYLSGTGRFARRERSPFPRLVFLDIKLPYRSGLQLLAWIRQQAALPPLFVVVLTSSNEPSDLKKAYELGADTYLVKPPSAQTICDIVESFKLDWLHCHVTPT